MDSDNIFRLDLSLQKLAKISIVLTFWEKQGVRQKIGDSFNSIQDLVPDPDLLNKIDGGPSRLQKVIDCIFEQLNFINLPNKLSDEIRALTTIMGQKIYYWRQYVIRTLRISSKWADKIYWTSNGDIDELKIIQEFWLKDSGFPSCNCSTEIEEKYSSDLERICHRRKKDYKSFQIAESEIFWKDQTEARVATWLWFCTNILPEYWKNRIFRFCRSVPDTFNEFKASFDQLPAKDLLFPCIDLYFEFGVKYTWQRLTTSEKKFTAVECANKCLDNIRSLSYDEDEFGKRISSNRWEKEKGLKLLLFFINETPEIQRTQFLEKTMPCRFLSIYELIAGIWPYQEFCGKILHAFPEFVSKHHSLLLDFNIYRLISDFESPMYVTNQTFYHGMLLILFDIVPKPAILNFFTKDNFKIIKKVLRKFNYSTFFILKNVDLKDYKNEILEIMKDDFKQLVCQGRYTVFHEFIQNLKLSDSELKLLKRKFNLLTNFLILGNFESADEYLNWRCDTEDEKNQIKNQVDAVQLCSAFVLSDYFKIANNFLIWRFDTEDERKEIKKALNLKGTTSETDFLRNKIFNFKTPEKCNELLKWFFESEEDITEFRKTEIIRDEFFLEEYWNSKKSFSSLDEFLIQICLMPSVEIETFKIKVADEIDWYMDTFALGKCKFEMVDDLLDWIYEDENEKRNIIRKYMNSPRGCLLCIKIFNERENPDACNFFNDWIEESFDYSELLTSLNKCDNNCSVRGFALESIRFFLLKKEQRDVVTFIRAKYGGPRKIPYYLCSSDEDEDSKTDNIGGMLRVQP